MSPQISLAEFSPVPVRRTREDGDKSGQVFREDLLLPKIREAEQNRETVVVSLDGVSVISSDFLDEGFAGLVYWDRYTPDQLRKLLRVESKDPAFTPYIDLLWEFVDEAQKEREHA